MLRFMFFPRRRVFRGTADAVDTLSTRNPRNGRGMHLVASCSFLNRKKYIYLNDPKQYNWIIQYITKASCQLQYYVIWLFTSVNWKFTIFFKICSFFSSKLIRIWKNLFSCMNVQLINNMLTLRALRF